MCVGNTIHTYIHKYIRMYVGPVYMYTSECNSVYTHIVSGQVQSLYVRSGLDQLRVHPEILDAIV